MDLLATRVEDSKPLRFRVGEGRGGFKGLGL